MANKINLTEEEYEAIIDYLADCRHDPLKFVMLSFPWGEENTPLADKKGPEQWQIEVMQEIANGLKSVGQVIREAVASGHGIGKSALVSWLILWAVGTHEDTRGVVTANTEPQLRTKTWPELAKWYHMWIAKELFTYTATSIYANDPEHEKTWKIDAIPWNIANTEAFAGLHNQGNRILIVFDEASAIEDIIWEVTEGALTDDNTEIIWCCFGNPTRNTGRFYECFHKQRDLWQRRQVDSRTVSFSNKRQLEEWRITYGEDSDFFKVRVKGEFPASSDKQFISKMLVEEAQHRVIKTNQYNFAPVILGLDPAWDGGDETVIYLRQGLYCKRLLKQPKNDNHLQLAGRLAMLEDEYKADAVFIDLGEGTGVKSAGDAWGRNWTLVPFGGRSERPDCKNKRAEMWANMKDWLIKGGVLQADDYELADDLTAPELAPTDDGKIQLERKEHMRKRGVHSPNCADALALTFAYPVLSKRQEALRQRIEEIDNEKYDPFHDM